MPDLVGRTLGRYEITREISRNDSRDVYEANDTMLARTVRISVVHPRLIESDPSLKRRLTLAIARLKQLSHARIARMYALEEIEGYVCVISEYTPGHSLRDLLQRQGALRPEQARQIVDDIGAALDEAHRQGILDVDVSPTNIVVSAEGQATLVDLGLTQILQFPRADSRDRTRGGPPTYMAPEIARGKMPSRSSDNYALGIVLYEMLTGRPPFQGDASSVMLAHMNQMPLPPSQVNRRLPRAVDTVLAKALAKDPADRYASATQMAGDLKSLTAYTAPTLPTSSRTWRLLGAIVLLIVALAWGFHALSGRRQREHAAPPSGAASMGTYEVTLPKRIQPGEEATVRLAIHIPGNLSPQDLPTILPKAYQASVDSALYGSVGLCRCIWARLESADFTVSGPNTVRRTVRSSGAEWLWNICCRPEIASSGKRPAAIQIFVRQAGADGVPQDLLLKEIRFDIEVTTGGLALPAAVLGIGAAVALALVLFVIYRVGAQKQLLDSL